MHAAAAYTTPSKLQVADYLQAQLADWARAFWAAAASSPSNSVQAQHLCASAHIGLSDAIYSHHPTVASVTTSLAAKLAILPPRAHSAAVSHSLVPVSGAAARLPVDANDGPLCAALAKQFAQGDTVPPAVALHAFFKMARGARNANASIRALAPQTRHALRSTALQRCCPAKAGVLSNVLARHNAS